MWGAAPQATNSSIFNNSGLPAAAATPLLPTQGHGAASQPSLAMPSAFPGGPSGTERQMGAEVGGGGPPHDATTAPPVYDAMQNDPLLNAGKAVWSGMKGLFSAVKGGEAGKQNGDSQQNKMYYDHAAKRWREYGAENEPDASQYDPMTGKKLNPHETASLVSPPPPPMGGPPPPNEGSLVQGGPPLGAPQPMGGPPLTQMTGGPPPPFASASAAAAAVPAGRGALYVNPLSGLPHMAGPAGGNQNQPSIPPGPPPGVPGMGGRGGAGGGMPLASPFAAQGAPLASPFSGGIATASSLQALQQSPF